MRNMFLRETCCFCSIFFKLQSDQNDPDPLCALWEKLPIKGQSEQKKDVQFQGLFIFCTFYTIVQTSLPNVLAWLELRCKIERENCSTKNCYAPSFCTTTWELSKNCVKGAT